MLSRSLRVAARCSNARLAPLALRSSTSKYAMSTMSHNLSSFKTATSVPRVSVYSHAHRTLFIQTQDTPNPRALKFVPGKDVLGQGDDATSSTVFFDSSQRGLARSKSTLAYTILCIEGVSNVLLGSDFLTVTVDESVDWLTVKPQVFAAISDAFASSEPILKEEMDAGVSLEQPHDPEDAEIVELIKEILDVRVRPSVMEDGGDIEFIKFDKNRIVWLLMKGSCSGCPSSGATLKHGIQNMIMHYVPEVEGVEEWVDEDLQRVNEEVIAELEAKLAEQQKETSTNTKKE